MPSWWRKSSKDVKKSKGESFIGSFRRTCIGPGAPRRQRSDTTSENVSQSRADSQSPSPSKQVLSFQSFGERPQAQPLPLPGSNSTNIYPADSGGRKSKGPPVDRGSKPRILLPLPKPGHVKIIRKHAEGGERYLATASSSSDNSSDTDDPYDSRLLSPQASDYENGVKSDAASPSGLTQRDKFPFAHKKSSKEMLKSDDIVLNCRTSPTSPNQRPVDAKVAHLQVPHQGLFFSALDSSMSSPSRSPMRVIYDEPSNGGFWLGKPYADLSQIGSGHCSSPSSVHNSGHNSVAGDVSYQLFWPQSRCSPECSPLPSPRMTSPGPSSRIQSGTVTPLHPCSGGPSAESSIAWLEDGRQQSHRLPLPPKTRYNSPFTASFSAGNSPTIARSPGRPDNPTSPGSRWKKGRLLGRGTFGHVYLGFNSESGEMCAMKEVTLFSDDARSRESAQQLGQEIALLSCLRHPNIVQYYGSETVDDKLYIYLEFVSGGSIYKILQEYGQLGEAAIRTYTYQIVSGLAYLHGQNTIHRDIKGANILVDPNGRVKLADFGMAKHINGQSCPLSFKGSPYWMAPEVINNSSGYNLAVDIWSLGCTVLEMATTKPPWSQYEGVAAMFKIGNSKELPEIPNHLSEEGKDFVRQCLQRNPSNRPTAAKLLEHPFVKNSVLLERPVPLSDPKESIPALTYAVRELGFGNSRTPCLDLPGAVSRSKTPKTGPGFSDGYVSRNIRSPVPLLASPRSCPRSPQCVNGRLSPSPISSPRATSSASTPTGGNVGAIPRHHLKTANNSHGNSYQEHKPDVFRGIVQAHLSLESVSRENKVRGNKVERPVLNDQNEQLYDAPRVLADRVSQQLLRNPVRIYQGPSSPLPSPRNLY